jgi:hypothetical protein
LKIEPSIRMITIKLQYNNFDEGEFTEEQPIEFESFIKIFDELANDRIYSKYSWTINNNYIKYFIKVDNAHCMVIEHISKDVYSITFAEQIDKYAFCNNFYNDTVKELCKLYFNKDFSILKEKLVKSDIKATIFLKRFIQIDYTYSYKYKKIFDLIFGLFYLLAGIILLIIGIEIPLGINIIPLLFSISFLTGYFFLIKLHLNHLKESKNKSITISSVHDEIIVTDYNSEITFTKSDIKRLLIVKSAGFRNPYVGYEFAQIILKNDSIINISSMIMDPFLIAKKIEGVEKLQKVVTYAYIKPRTNFTVN